MQIFNIPIFFASIFFFTYKDPTTPDFGNYLRLINIFLGPQHPPVWPQTRAGVGFRAVFHASATRPRCSAAASPLSHRFFSVPENDARTALQQRKSERFFGKKQKSLRAGFEVCPFCPPPNKDGVRRLSAAAPHHVLQHQGVTYSLGVFQFK